MLTDLERLSRRLNVYRGQLLEVTQTPMGGVSLDFLGVPATGRDDVVLPEAVLDRVEPSAQRVVEQTQAPSP